MQICINGQFVKASSKYCSTKWRNFRMEPIILYHFQGSVVSRSVLLLIQFMGLAHRVKDTNIFAGETMTPEFIKMNPMHTVPTIDDNGFYLWESRAIMQYLVDQYGKDDSLSPTVPKLAAIVNQQLYFDACTLNARLYEYMLPIMMRSAKPNMEVHAKVEEALGVFDTILSKNKWVAGDNLTIADFALMSTVSTLEAIMFDIKKYPNVENWLNSCKRDVTHFEETIQKGSDWIHDYYLNKTKDY